MQLPFTANEAKELGNAVSAMITHGIQLPELVADRHPAAEGIGPQQTESPPVPGGGNLNLRAPSANENPNTP